MIKYVAVQREADVHVRPFTEGEDVKFSTLGTVRLERDDDGTYRLTWNTPNAESAHLKLELGRLECFNVLGERFALGLFDTEDEAWGALFMESRRDFEQWEFERWWRLPDFDY